MKGLITMAGAVLLGTVASPPAQAAFKTWVSSTGVDSGTCQLTAPCKTLQYAQGQTDASGEIDVKDAGGYGAVTLTKAISVVAEGVLATINAPAGSAAVAISAGPNDAVMLRGLTIDGHDTSGSVGITVKAGQVSIDGCDVRRTHIGLEINAPGAQVDVTDSTFQHNYYGIYVDDIQVLVLGNDHILRNVYGVGTYSGSSRPFYSYRDNDINLNTSADLANVSLTSLSKQ